MILILCIAFCTFSRRQESFSHLFFIFKFVDFFVIWDHMTDDAGFN